MHGVNRETTTMPLDHCPACDGTDLYQVRLCPPVHLNKVTRTAIQFGAIPKCGYAAVRLECFLVDGCVDISSPSSARFNDGRFRVTTECSSEHCARFVFTGHWPL